MSCFTIQGKNGAQQVCTTLDEAKTQDWMRTGDMGGSSEHHSLGSLASF